MDTSIWPQLLADVKENDRIEITEVSLGFLRAGDVQPAHREGQREGATYSGAGSIRYMVRIASTLGFPAKLAALLHELAHVYCGHLGFKKGDWWNDRQRVLNRAQMEFEAEATAYIVARRLGIEGRSAIYLSNHVQDGDLASVSVDAILRAANRIESMLPSRSPGRL